MQIQGETSVNKLIILFVFDKMESALSERTIVEMCTTSNNWLNYMDCMELLPKLLEDGFICRLSSDEEPLYSITTDGRESLSNFYINIPKSIREEISAFVKKNSGKLRNRQECKADYYQNKDGTYTVFLKIIAPVQPMLELKFVVPDKKRRRISTKIGKAKHPNSIPPSTKRWWIEIPKHCKEVLKYVYLFYQRDLFKADPLQRRRRQQVERRAVHRRLRR